MILFYDESMHLGTPSSNRLDYWEAYDELQRIVPPNDVTAILDQIFALVRHAIEKDRQVSGEKVNTIMDYAGYNLKPHELEIAALIAEEKSIEMHQEYVIREKSLFRRLGKLMAWAGRKCMSVFGPLDESNRSRMEEADLKPKQEVFWKTTETLLRAELAYRELQQQNEPFQQQQNSLY